MLVKLCLWIWNSWKALHSCRQILHCNRAVWRRGTCEGTSIYNLREFYWRSRKDYSNSTFKCYFYTVTVFRRCFIIAVRLVLRQEGPERHLRGNRIRRSEKLWFLQEKSCLVVIFQWRRIKYLPPGNSRLNPHYPIFIVDSIFTNRRVDHRTPQWLILKSHVCI